MSHDITPAQLARDFLDAMEARDLVKAKSYLGGGFNMIFPNSPVFHELEALIAWSTGRYQSVRKTYEGVDECPAVDAPNQTTVYCRGTLSGAWGNGTPFEGIRFIDRFTVLDGKLMDHKVWNDMAEARPKGVSSDQP